MNQHLGILVLMVTTMAVMITSVCHARSDLHPVILVPGNGGNQLEARLTKEYKPSSLVCRLWNRAGWFRLWFEASVLLAPFTKCFAERMTLYYDPIQDDYQNAPGVETRVPYFGSTQGLMYLNPEIKHITAYMAPLVKAFEQNGYLEGETLFGAPYDFRYGLAPENRPCHIGSKFLQDLKNLIEEAYESNGGKPVIILSHSLGGLFVLHLLNRNTMSWRNKYVKHFIALSAPWGGTVQEMLTFASGYSLGVPLVDPLLVRDEQRSSESNLWLLPSPKIFGHSKPLVITDNTTYSAHDMPQFLNDIGFPQGVFPYERRIVPLVDKLIAPEVPITCIIGHGVKTHETLFYGKNGFDKQPEIVYGDGDGTVNLLSLLAVESEWADIGNQYLKVIQIPNVSHTSILKDDVALEAILGEISDINLNGLGSAE